MMAQYPLGFGQWLQALAYALSKPREIAIVGDPDSADTEAVLLVLREPKERWFATATGPSRSWPWEHRTDNALVVARCPAITGSRIGERASRSPSRNVICQASISESEVPQAQLERP
jgi:hypothetical protein